MMSAKKALEHAGEIMREKRRYDHIITLMTWDTLAYMPETGRAYRNETAVYFMGKRTQLFVTAESRAAAEILRELAPADFSSDTERGLARMFLLNFKQSNGVPLDLQEEIAKMHFVTSEAWQKARREKDYQIWKPSFQQFFELKRRAAQAADPNTHPLQVMINDYDEDLTVETCGRLLGELKSGISELLFRVLPAAQAVDDSILEIFKHNQPVIDELGSYLCHCFGYTSGMASFAKVIHGWTAVIGPADARVTVSGEDSGIDTLFTYAHEMGHCLYSVGSRQDVIDAGIWEGLKGSAHESQSRFYENIICRSEEFWQFFFPFLQARFPQLRDWEGKDFYKVLMRVKPQFKRTTADELTYSLHPVIRFELERDLFDGRLDFDHLAEAWDDRYEEALGIRPSNDLEGCLQDIHWTEGFGLFQCYAMGNIFDGQLLACIKKDMPDFYGQIAEGKFDKILSWLRQHVHQYGSAYPTMELMEKAVGGEISSKYYVEYMRKKYGLLYGITE